MIDYLLTLLPSAGRWWDQIPEGIRLLFSIAAFLVPLLVLTIILYLAGLLVVGGRRAKFGDAFLIAFLGTLIGMISALFISSLLLLLFVEIIVWLGLIKHFYETGWLGALAVAILSVIVYLIILIILAIAFAISFILLEKMWPFIIVALL